MKKLILLIALIISFVTTNAQDVIDTMAQEVCNCMTDRNVLDINDQQKLITAVGICIAESYTTHQQQVSTELGIDELNDETGHALGNKVGVRMMKYCPDYLMKMGQVASQNTSGKSTYVLNGKVDSMEKGDFITYKLKDSEGKIHKLLWYQHFKGSDDLIDDPKKLVGKNVSVTLKDVECYIPKAQAYYSIKEIVELKME